MDTGMEMKYIARIHTDFTTKFGVPRQSGLVPALQASIVFEPPYRNPDALRGIEGFSHLWLVWHFSEMKQEAWSPTVRPPRLGGNTRMGVFATRSPNRPNPIGLSSVRLEGVDWHTPDGPVLRVSGVDLMDGTPLLDIKPYLAYTDSHPQATGGFVADLSERHLSVDCPEVLLQRMEPDKREALLGVLAQDPRPAYQQDGERVYGLDFAGWQVHFTVADGCLRVTEIEKI
ncbi:MAG: tRNA (N6-threonylcarbamoyladenosine(37)-N6)-methyltransferase TrmO [Clostridia bacterium]|nr:tRNA (N6-threonylcarbamoyladenosine(37)-N6)-methyltransferase TrmO [Clostridia bacterium]